MRLATIVWLVATVAHAAPPKLVVPAEVRPAGQYIRFTPETDAEGIEYIGLSGLDAIPSDVLKDSRLFLLDTRGLAKGRYRFTVVGWKGPDRTRADFHVVIGDAKPVDPVDPVDPDVKAPIPVAGFRVLFVYDNARKREYTPAQVITLELGGGIREYLDAKCVKGPDSRTPEWRNWSNKQDVTGDTEVWRNAMARPRTADPWLLISDGTKGYEGPLPATAAETLALLKKYGG